MRVANGGAKRILTALVAAHAPKIAAQGYCVFSLTYGTGVLGPGVGGLASMRDSAAQLGRFVDRVRGATGAAQVDIVGHSEGSTMPAYYLKFLGGAAKVAHFVGFGANYRGTTLGGLDALLQDFCPPDASGHLSQAIDPNVTGLILHALDPAYPPACTPFTLPL
jgi:hypothetical protein